MTGGFEKREIKSDPGGQWQVAKRQVISYSTHDKRQCRGIERTFPPISPYQLFEGVYADIVGVHILNDDVALLEVFLVDLVGVPRTRCEQ